MRQLAVLMGIAVLAPAVLFGCASPERGQGDRIQVTGIAERRQEGGLGHRAKEDFRDTTDALGITPRVKAAIISDPQLNDKRNHINVGTKDYVLHLTGWVYSPAVKTRAARVAAHKLKAMHKNYKVSNELKVRR